MEGVNDTVEDYFIPAYSYNAVIAAAKDKHRVRGILSKSVQNNCSTIHSNHFICKYDSYLLIVIHYDSRVYNSDTLSYKYTFFPIY